MIALRRLEKRHGDNSGPNQPATIATRHLHRLATCCRLLPSGKLYSFVAQLVEHLVLAQKVPCSSQGERAIHWSNIMYIIQHDYRSDLRIENMRNASARRCRVKNVRYKSFWPYQPPMQTPLDAYRYRKPLNDFTDPCAGCAGKVCNNFACPKRTGVTW